MNFIFSGNFTHFLYNIPHNRNLKSALCNDTLVVRSGSLIDNIFMETFCYAFCTLRFWAWKLSGWGGNQTKIKKYLNWFIYYLRFKPYRQLSSHFTARIKPKASFEVPFSFNIFYIAQSKLNPWSHIYKITKMDINSWNYIFIRSVNFTEKMCRIYSENCAFYEKV